MCSVSSQSRRTGSAVPDLKTPSSHNNNWITVLATGNTFNIAARRSSQSRHSSQHSVTSTQSSSSKSKVVVRPSFLSRLLSMVTSKDQNAISYHDGNVLVHDPVRLASELLPRYFRHSKLTSFQRQLSYFGFRKIVGKGWLKGKVPETILTLRRQTKMSSKDSTKSEAGVSQRTPLCRSASSAKKGSARDIQLTSIIHNRGGIAIPSPRIINHSKQHRTTLQEAGSSKVNTLLLNDRENVLRVARGMTPCGYLGAVAINQGHPNTTPFAMINNSNHNTRFGQLQHLASNDSIFNHNSVDKKEMSANLNKVDSFDGRRNSSMLNLTSRSEMGRVDGHRAFQGVATNLGNNGGVQYGSGRTIDLTTGDGSPDNTTNDQRVHNARIAYGAVTALCAMHVPLLPSDEEMLRSIESGRLWTNKVHAH